MDDGETWDSPNAREYFRHAATEPGALYGARAADLESFGPRAISFWDSFVLLVNNLTGPGMVALPFLFVHAGWAVPTLALLLIAGLSILSCLCLAEAISRIPGNSSFQLRVEWSNVFGYYFGSGIAGVVQALVLLCLTALNSAAIDAVGQVADGFLSELTGRSWGFQPGSSPLGPAMSWVSDTSGFSGLHSPIITAGYLYAMVLIVPLSWVR